MAGIDRLCGRFPETLSANNSRRSHLADHRRDSRARNAHLRQAEQAENEQRIEHDVDDRARYLRDGGRFHVAAGLQNLGPDTLEEQPAAEHAHDAAVYDHVADNVRRAGGYFRIERQDEPACGREQRPQRQRQRRADSGISIRLIGTVFAVFRRHDGVDAHARSHRQRDHQQLDGIDDGERGQTGFGKTADEQAVHDVIQSLNELRQHHRRRQLEQDAADLLPAEKFCGVHKSPRFCALLPIVIHQTARTGKINGLFFADLRRMARQPNKAIG